MKEISTKYTGIVVHNSFKDVAILMKSRDLGSIILIQYKSILSLKKLIYFVINNVNFFQMILMLPTKKKVLKVHLAERLVKEL